MNTITKEQVLAILNESKLQDTKMGEKTTVLHCTLPNGFEIVESSACVDPANYDHVIGLNVYMDRLENRIWQLEGYRLQSELAHQ